VKPRLERFEPDPFASVRLFRRRGKRFAFDWHLHQEVELTCITHGHGHRYVASAIEPYTPGDFILIGSEVPHTWASHPSSTHNQAVVAQFNPDTIEGWPELSAIERLIQRARQGLVFESPKLKRTFESLLKTVGLQRWLGMLSLLESLAELDASHVRALSSVEDRDAKISMEPKARTVFAMLNEHFREDLQQIDVAQRIGLSSAAFSRYFRRLTGGTFTQYLQRLRVSEACRLLIDTTTPITDIAFAAGFQNLSHFNRVFRHWTQATPRDYRQRHAPM